LIVRAASGWVRCAWLPSPTATASPASSNRLAYRIGVRITWNGSQKNDGSFGVGRNTSGWSFSSK